MAEQQVTLVMVLPLRGIGYILEAAKDREELGNGYALVNSKLLSELKRFDERFMTKIVPENDWSQISKAPLYLQASYACVSADDIGELEANASEWCGEKIDRFLLALNMTERLWSFRPDIRLTWFENDFPLSWQNITIRHYHPLSLFEKKPTLEDFHAAARLTGKIDDVYSDADKEGEDYPALRTAFSAIRLGTYAFDTSMRFLQEAIALESLCSTEATEVAHRIAVTCALCLESALDERKKMYKEAKDLYGIRSRVIHGSGRQVTKEELKRIEQLSRKLLRHVLNDNVLPKFRTRDSQREFLLDLPLGGF